jgi:carbamoyl-phosphate synthase large subunit
MTDRFTVLLTSVGRRSELVDIARASIAALGLEPYLIGANASPLAPALHFCDEAVAVPTVDDPAYPAAIESLIRDRGVRLVVPLIDTELQLHADQRERFEAAGAVSLISAPEVIRRTQDKYETYRFFRDAGIPAPAAALPGEPADVLGLPVVVKPRRGSSSEDVFFCTTAEERDARLSAIRDPMAQQLALGTEFTMDVLTDLDGRLVNVVVRERIKTRGGESIIGVTVARPDLWEWTARICAAMPFRGPVTIQCFDDGAGTVLFTEINARFGGGYPLADAAGADYVGLVARMCLGEAVAPRIGTYRTGLAMSRYDRSVYFDLAEGAAASDSWTSESSGA